MEGLTQKLQSPSPLAPLPKRERGTRKFSYSPSPVLGERDEGNFNLRKGLESVILT